MPQITYTSQTVVRQGNEDLHSYSLCNTRIHSPGGSDVWAGTHMAGPLEVCMLDLP